MAHYRFIPKGGHDAPHTVSKNWLTVGLRPNQLKREWDHLRLTRRCHAVRCDQSMVC